MFYVEHFPYSTVRAWPGWPGRLFEKHRKPDYRDRGKMPGEPFRRRKRLVSVRKGRAIADEPVLHAHYSLNNPGAENKSGATWKG